MSKCWEPHPRIATTINPFRTAVPFWGQTSPISNSLSPKRDCGSKGNKLRLGMGSYRPLVRSTSKGEVFNILGTSSMKAFPCTEAFLFLGNCRAFKNRSYVPGMDLRAVTPGPVTRIPVFFRAGGLFLADPSPSPVSAPPSFSPPPPRLRLRSGHSVSLLRHLLRISPTYTQKQGPKCNTRIKYVKDLRTYSSITRGHTISGTRYMLYSPRVYAAAAVFIYACVNPLVRAAVPFCGQNYLQFEWVVPKTRLQSFVKGFHA